MSATPRTEPRPPLAAPPEIRRVIEAAVEVAWPRTGEPVPAPSSGWPAATRRSWRFAGRSAVTPGERHPGFRR
jgi:hypothetical protein